MGGMCRTDADCCSGMGNVRERDLQDHPQVTAIARARCSSRPECFMRAFQPRRGRRLDPQRRAEHGEVDLVGNASDPLVREAGDLDEHASERRRRMDAHADFVGDEHGVKSTLLQDAHHVVGTRQDPLHRFLMEEQVREPERQTIDDGHVVLGECVERGGRDRPVLPRS